MCKVYDSPCLPESECIFAIHDSGIIDAAEWYLIYFIFINYFYNKCIL